MRHLIFVSELTNIFKQPMQLLITLVFVLNIIFSLMWTMITDVRGGFTHPPGLQPQVTYNYHIIHNLSYDTSVLHGLARAWV